MVSSEGSESEQRRLLKLAAKALKVSSEGSKCAKHRRETQPELDVREALPRDAAGSLPRSVYVSSTLSKSASTAARRRRKAAAERLRELEVVEVCKDRRETPQAARRGALALA